jgi:hypothetical protein
MNKDIGIKELSNAMDKSNTLSPTETAQHLNNVLS